MNAATEFDTGPLTWVKSEIDLALGRALQALGEFDASADATQVKFCRTHLHQVLGALTIVGLDGVTQFAEALEGLLEAIETRDPPVAGGSAPTALARRGLEAIGHYLGSLVNGQPNQPLRLLPLYREIQEERGASHCPADLFFPDLSVRSPRDEEEVWKLDPDNLALLLKQERIRFQRGLLAWLRAPRDKGGKEGVRDMLTAIRRIERTQEVGAARAFWRVAGGFLAALAGDGVEDEAGARQLCARIDTQIRRLLEGSRNVAERLMRDTLYHVALSTSDDAAVGQIKQAYHLESFLPDGESAVPDAAQAVLSRLRDTTLVMEEAWNKFCAGSAPALQSFKENARALTGLAESLGQADYRRLAQSLAAAAIWLAEDAAKRHSDTLAMEIATAVLLLQNAQANPSRLGADFAHQVDVIIDRVHACIAGRAPKQGGEVPLLDEISRRAQEKLLLGQVAKEIQANLLQIEQVLDGFFRDTAKRPELGSLETPFRQIGGALDMLRQEGALAALRDCQETVRRFFDPNCMPAEGELEQLASRLSVVGFFVDNLPRGVTDFEAFERRMQTPRRGAASAPEDGGEAGEAGVSVEQEVVQNRREAHALLGALKEQPTDETLREEVRQNLATLKSDADLVADAELGNQAEAMLTALESGVDVTISQIDRAMAVMKPEAAETLPPSQETLQLSQASSDEIDAELLAIFIEEAHDVLSSVDTNLRALRKYPHDTEALTVARRAFHTLKGSGRMVGLKDLGEAAWAIEQTLNLWLRIEQEVDAPLLGLLDEAYALFTAWVGHLETREGQTPDPAALIARADGLRASTEAAQENAGKTLEAEEEPARAEPARGEPTAPLDIRLADAPVVDAAPVVETPREAEVAPEPVAAPPETETAAPESIEIDFALPEETTDGLAAPVLEEPPDAPEAQGTVETLEALEMPEEQETPPLPQPPQSPLPPRGGGAGGEGGAPPPPETSETPETLSLEIPEPAENDETSPEAENAPRYAPAWGAGGGRQGIGISPALFTIFSEEARRYLHTLRRELPALESEEIRPTPHEMYRAAHTLAGISATVGLHPVSQLGHALEYALQRRDASEKRGSLEALGTVRRAVGELESMFSALAEQRDIDIPAGLIEELDTLYPPGALSTGAAETLESLEALEMPEAPDAPDEPVLAGEEALEIPEVADELENDLETLAEPESPPPALDTQTPDALERPETPDALEIPEQAIGSVPSPRAGEGQREERAAEHGAPPSPAQAQNAPAAPHAPPTPLALTLVHDEIDAQLLPIFLEEAADLTQSIARQLRDWRADPGSEEAVRILARHLHTLKGSARMAGAMTLGEITHALETRIDEAGKRGAAPPELIDGIENTFESIRQIIDRLQRGETLDPALAPAAPAPETVDAPGEPDSPAPPDAPPVVERRRRATDARAEPEAEGEAAPAQATLRVRAHVVDRLVNEAGELSITRSRVEGEMRGMKESLLDLTENVIRLRRQLREIEIQAELQMQSGAASADEKHAGFDPLEFDRFTRFQELTRMMAESVNDVSTVQQNLLKNLDDANAALAAQSRQNREVQQGLMSMRMMPFNSLTDRLYRVLRQASKDLDKRANLEIRGGQVELDRGVLDKIAVPLEHMLRNSVAHGIEKVAERARHGKPEIGEITLSLKQEGNEIVLVLADDGAGLDYERIRERARAARMIGPNETPDEARLAEFIFAPGFSTAGELSRTAGRGVGMDVVKTEIAGLGGRIEVESQPGRGTEFRLILPLTLVVTKALLIRAGSMSFAIPSTAIEQVLDRKEADITHFREAGEVEWQSRRYPFSYLPRLLGDAEAAPARRRQYWVLLLKSGTRRIAVQVDELIGNQEIVVKNIGPQLARVVGVGGATVLGDGQVVLILNPVALSARAQAEAARLADEAAAESTTPTVMVVDDSLTVRKITGRLMAREGYQVMLARDGVEALEQLIDILPDVILTDIEMPRMDGFDLARNIRADARLRNLPIIAITSRTAEKHRDYARSIGITHYLGKPYQEEELLELVAKYVR